MGRIRSGNETHPWRRKADRMVNRFERIHEAASQVTLDHLMAFGVPFGELVGPEEALSEIDRFETENGLELAGVDVVLSRFEQARYDHNEYGGHDELED